MIRYVELHRFKKISFHQNRYLYYLILIQLRIINTFCEINFIIVFNLFFYKKNIIKKTKNFPIKTFILWNSFDIKFSSYIYKKMNKKYFKKKIFTSSKYIDVYSTMFDLFNLFENCYDLKFFIISFKEEILVKTIMLEKTMIKKMLILFKNSITLKTIFFKFRNNIQLKQNTKAIKLNCIFDNFLFLF